jgi:hypothetical protein
VSHKIKFYAIDSADPSAGIPSLFEEIEITFRHSSEMDFEKEDSENIANFLSDFYNGARILSEKQYNEMIEAENNLPELS